MHALVAATLRRYERGVIWLARPVHHLKAGPFIPRGISCAWDTAALCLTSIALAPGNTYKSGTDFHREPTAGTAFVDVNQIFRGEYIETGARVRN